MLDQPRLEAALTKAKLVIGPVSESLPQFIDGRPSPVGFVSVEVDLYSSTVDALKVFQTDHDRLLPRIITYFDDIDGHTYFPGSDSQLANSMRPARIEN